MPRYQVIQARKDLADHVRAVVECTRHSASEQLQKNQSAIQNLPKQTAQNLRFFKMHDDKPSSSVEE
jgi:phenylacetate-coenzyme A ligase PaaK-like adenylate-forming protein